MSDNSRPMMIPQEFLEAIATERGVSDSEFKVLSQAIGGESPSAIATKFGTRPEVIRNRLGVVYKKFHIPGAGPGKLAKLQQILISEYQVRQTKSDVRESLSQQAQDQSEQPCSDWSEVPDISIFYGRTQELATLKQWIVGNNCRMVTVLGMAGVGKTALSVKLAQQIQEHFDHVIWRSLRHTPSPENMLAELIQFLSYPQKIHLPENVNSRVALLIDCLRKRRCLIVLDGVETILRREELAGQYCQEYQAYGEIFRRIAELAHNSCLVITSQEKPTDIALLHGETLIMEGLSSEDAREIFQSNGLSDSNNWPVLIDRYRGNPLVLKIVATTIQELFNGRVSEFLKRSTFVFGDIKVVLEQQFNRLSDLEKEILYWLAIAQKFLSLEELQERLWLPIPESEIFEALESLRRRSLIQKNMEETETVFTLQLVVNEYVISQLVDQVCLEIMEAIKTNKAEKLELVRSLNFAASLESLRVGKIGASSIVEVVKNQMIMKLSRDKRSHLEDYINKIVAHLSKESQMEVGYALDNLRLLIISLKDNNRRFTIS